MNSVSCRAKISNGAQLADLQFTKCSKLSSLQSQAVAGAKLGAETADKSADYQRLKAEQSATSDLPLQAMPVEMRSGIYAAIVASARKNLPLPVSPFAKNPAQHLTRTASALAPQPAAAIQEEQTQEEQTQEEQTATMGALPAFGARGSLHVQKVAPKSEFAGAPRRQLLPPPKTQFLPGGDPCELRNIVEKVQARRSQTIEKALLSSHLQSISAAHPSLRRQDDADFLAKCHRILSTDIGLLVIGPTRRTARRLGDTLRRLLDRLAVA